MEKVLNTPLDHLTLSKNFVFAVTIGTLCYTFAPLNPTLCEGIIPSTTVRTYLEKAYRSAHVAMSYNLPTHAKKTELSSLCYNQLVLLILSEHEGKSLFLDAQLFSFWNYQENIKVFPVSLPPEQGKFSLLLHVWHVDFPNWTALSKIPRTKEVATTFGGLA